jgi:hypothetical protein
LAFRIGFLFRSPSRALWARRTSSARIESLPRFDQAAHVSITVLRAYFE